jgi:MFS family permease
MANLPTYAQIGITASWIIMFCRMAQGMSSLGEIMGAEIYIAESVTRPASYPAVAFVSVSATLGGMVALGLASLATSFYMNWRIAFWIGAIIAFIGAFARSRLRETPEFLAMKRKQIKESQLQKVLRKGEQSQFQDNFSQNFCFGIGSFEQIFYFLCDAPKSGHSTTHFSVLP